MKGDEEGEMTRPDPGGVEGNGGEGPAGSMVNASLSG